MRNYDERRDFIAPEAEEDRGEYNYSCHIDLDYTVDDEGIDYKKVMKMIEDGEIGVFYVTKSKGCPCCKKMEEVDSIYGIKARDAQEALKVGIEYLE